MPLGHGDDSKTYARSSSSSSRLRHVISFHVRVVAPSFHSDVEPAQDLGPPSCGCSACQGQTERGAAETSAAVVVATIRF